MKEERFGQDSFKISFFLQPYVVAGQDSRGVGVDQGRHLKEGASERFWKKRRSRRGTGEGRWGVGPRAGSLCGCGQLVSANSSSCIFLSTYYVPGLF